jgi:hypothetical protein
MRFFHFIHAEQFQFYSSVQFPILSSLLLIPSSNSISLTNQSKNYCLKEDERDGGGDLPTEIRGLGSTSKWKYAQKTSWRIYA